MHTFTYQLWTIYESIWFINGSIYQSICLICGLIRFHIWPHIWIHILMHQFIYGHIYDLIYGSIYKIVYKNENTNKIELDSKMCEIFRRRILGQKKRRKCLLEEYKECSVGRAAKPSSLYRKEIWRINAGRRVWCEKFAWLRPDCEVSRATLISDKSTSDTHIIIAPDYFSRRPCFTHTIGVPSARCRSQEHRPDIRTYTYVRTCIPQPIKHPDQTAGVQPWDRVQGPERWMDRSSCLPLWTIQCYSIAHYAFQHAYVKILRQMDIPALDKLYCALNLPHPLSNTVLT